MKLFKVRNPIVASREGKSGSYYTNSNIPLKRIKKLRIWEGTIMVHRDTRQHAEGNKIKKLPDKNGNSEYHLAGKTISVMLYFWTNCIAGTWNNKSKPVKCPKVTPKSVSNFPTWEERAGVREVSPNRLILRYLKWNNSWTLLC